MSQDAKTLYSGTFERSMDAKKRVAVPAPWLTSEEGEIFYVIPHPSEGYLMVMPPSEFDRWEQRIQESAASAT
jgi:MraZ protein